MFYITSTVSYSIKCKNIFSVATVLINNVLYWFSCKPEVENK